MPRWGYDTLDHSPPQTPLGEPPNPLAGFNGSTSKGRWGKGKERGREGREGQGKGDGGEWKGPEGERERGEGKASNNLLHPSFGILEKMLAN